MPKVKQFDEQAALEKAMQLFWKQGFHATSMQDLVNHLGISRSSIYDTYGDKRTLFDAAFLYYRSSSIAGLEHFLDNQTSIKEGFRHLFLTAIKEAEVEKNGCFVVNTATELVPGDDEIEKVLQSNITTLTNIFQAFLQRGVDTGEVSKKKDLAAISNMFITYYNGIRVIAKMEKNPNVMKNTLNVLLSVLD